MNVRGLLLSRAAREQRLRDAHGRRRRIGTRSPLQRPTLPRLTYVICTNPRSGSWLLSEGLASTGLAGNPREWFNTLEEQQQAAEWRMSHSTDLIGPAYLRLARAKSTTNNGISGIKLHYYQFADLPRKLPPAAHGHPRTMAGLMAAVFPNPRYLWLTRRDKARQAVSYQLADDTNEWWIIDDGTSIRTEGRGDEPTFDPLAIARLECVLTENDARWQAYFRDNHIVPFVLFYEDLVSDYRGSILAVLNWLGVPDARAADIPPPRLKQQSNARNEEWLTRYTAFKRAGGDGADGSTSAGLSSPLFKRLQRPIDVLPETWKRWVAQSRLTTTDDAIVEVLVRNGYTRATALSELTTGSSADQGVVARGARHDKAASLLNVLGKVAQLDSRAGVIERRSNLSRDEFRDRYYATNRPIIILDQMTGWRAMHAWTPDYLKRVAGDHLVEVMAGRDADPKYETNAHQRRTTMRFADYVDLVYGGRTTNDYYLVANNLFFDRPEVQPLLDDFSAFPEYLDPISSARRRFFWFGPAGTVTPLHHDALNILIAQVVGRKRYRLIPASQWQYVYNSTGVFSDVDCEQPDLTRHPKFRHASVVDVVLEPGEVLFMPVGWWHHVRALDVSMTVSFTNFVFPNDFTWEP